eukprot:3178688-Rhodomonas_salina.2
MVGCGTGIAYGAVSSTGLAYGGMSGTGMAYGAMRFGTGIAYGVICPRACYTKCCTDLAYLPTSLLCDVRY